MEIGGVVVAYASGIGDGTLQARASFSKRKLKDLRDADLDDGTQAVHDIAAATPTAPLQAA